jgi:hypothetical protein
MSPYIFNLNLIAAKDIFENNNNFVLATKINI